MSKYETIFLVSNKITEEKRIELFNRIKEFITKNGSISSAEDLGEKKLAYEIRKHEKAFYYDIEFEANSEMILELERIYRITDEIIKFINIRKDD